MLDRGQNGSALFSLAGDDAEFLPGLVTYDGRFVTIDVSNLADHTQGELVFQLLNSDSDDGTQIAFPSIENTVDPDALIGPKFSPDNDGITAGTPVDLAGYSLNTQITTRFENIRFDSSTGRYRADLALQNNGSDIGRDIVVAFPGLPAGVTLLNPLAPQPW